MINQSRLRDVGRFMVESHLYPGVQLYVSRNDEVIVDMSEGVSTDGVSLQPDDFLPLLSASKSIIAIAIAQLWEGGDLGLDDRVCAYVAAYGRYGKDRVTVKHLLTHTVGPMGEPRGERPPDVPDNADWNSVQQYLVDQASSAKLDPSVGPGRRSEYSPAWSWALLAEIIQRVDGRSAVTYCNQEILLPLGADLRFGRPDPRAIGKLRTSPIYDTSRPSLGPLKVHAAETEGGSLPSAGVGMWGSARSLARVFEMLARGGLSPSDQRIIGARTVQEITRRQRPSLMENRPIIDVGLGFILEGRRHGPQFAYFGLEPSIRSFGHYGHRSRLVFCDPDHRLVVSVAGNGFPQWLRKHLAWRRLSREVYRGWVSMDDPSARRRDVHGSEREVMLP